MLEVSSEWLVHQFPELELLEDFTDPSPAALDFFLTQQSDARLGFLPVRSAAQGHFDPEKRYWPALKAEFREFLCTDSQKYIALREEFRTRAKRSEAVALSAITAAVAQVLSAAFATLVPLVAICLYAVARLGIAVYCRLVSAHETNSGRSRV